MFNKYMHRNMDYFLRIRFLFLLLSCIQVKAKISINISSITPCCHNNDEFDYYSRTCINNNNINFVKCHGALVDYAFNSQHISVLKNHMGATVITYAAQKLHEKKSLYQNEFCINKRSGSETGIVIRICDEKKYCDTHLCFSQCNFHSDKPLGQENFKTLSYDILSYMFGQYLSKNKEKYTYGLIKQSLNNNYKLVKEAWNVTQRGNVIIRGDSSIYKYNQYCISYDYDHLLNTVERRLYLIMEEEISWEVVLRTVSIACVFYTFIMYMFFPRSNDKNREHFLLFLGMNFFGYILEHFINLNIFIEEVECIIIGYLIRFFYYSGFLWLTVICANTWWNVRSSVLHYPMRYEANNSVRICYQSIIVYVLSFIQMLATCIAEMSLDNNSSFKPQLSSQTCTFASSSGKYYYWILPQFLLVFLNTMFIVMINKDWKIFKSKISFEEITNDEYENFRETLQIYDSETTKTVILLFIIGTSFVIDMALTITQGLVRSPYSLYQNDMPLLELLNILRLSIRSCEGILIWIFALVIPKLINMILK